MLFFILKKRFYFTNILKHFYNNIHNTLVYIYFIIFIHKLIYIVYIHWYDNIVRYIDYVWADKNVYNTLKL